MTDSATVPKFHPEALNSIIGENLSYSMPKGRLAVRRQQSYTETLEYVLQDGATGSDSIHLAFYTYESEESTTLLIDMPKGNEFLDPEHLEAVNYLRSNGRQLTSGEVIELLLNQAKYPDDPRIKVYSLWAMARFLVDASWMSPTRR